MEIKKAYVHKKCEHGRQCSSRCSQCLGHPINKGKCSRCKHPFQPVYILEKLVQTCDKCRAITCTHGNEKKSKCFDCQKIKIKCSHSKRKSRCQICSPDCICVHEILSENCKHCKPNLICEHSIMKKHCILCSPVNCEHNKRKNICPTCSPDILCQNCKHNISSANKTYSPYCFMCFCILNPNVEIKRRFKIKETHLQEALTEYNFINDKIIQGGCSKRRPDFLLDLFTHVLIIECDEDGHRGYDSTCELAKLNDTFTDLADRSLVILRFNPDSFEGKSCFDCDGKLIKSEWNKRIKALKKRIDHWLKAIPETLITTEYMFYTVK